LKLLKILIILNLEYYCPINSKNEIGKQSGSISVDWFRNFTFCSTTIHVLQRQRNKKVQFKKRKQSVGELKEN
jgi:hypothetical protein